MSDEEVGWVPGDRLYDVYSPGFRYRTGGLFTVKQDELDDGSFSWADAVSWTADPDLDDVMGWHLGGEDEVERFIVEYRAWDAAGRPDEPVSLSGCACWLCRGNTSPSGLWTTLLAPIFDEANLLTRAMADLDRRFFAGPSFDITPLLTWNPPPEPVTCPNLDRSGEITTRVSDWALAPALPVTLERFTPAARKPELPQWSAGPAAFWDRPARRRLR